jgi:hypothetical protein
MPERSGHVTDAQTSAFLGLISALLTLDDYDAIRSAESRSHHPDPEAQF